MVISLMTFDKIFHMGVYYDIKVISIEAKGFEDINLPCLNFRVVSFLLC